jgi:hypothetical protein
MGGCGDYSICPHIVWTVVYLASVYLENNNSDEI